MWEHRVCRHVFDRTSERSMISWNTILVAYAQNGYGDLSLKLLCQMPMPSIKPNSVSNFHSKCYSSMCLYSISVMGQGDPWLHTLKLIWARCVCWECCCGHVWKMGSLNDACQVFKKMYKRDVVAWTTIIVGYAMHGHVETTFTLFPQMQLEGLKPNKITFCWCLVCM